MISFQVKPFETVSLLSTEFSKKATLWVAFLLVLGESNNYDATVGGLLLSPVQTLVTSTIFFSNGKENANESRHSSHLHMESLMKCFRTDFLLY